MGNPVEEFLLTKQALGINLRGVGDALRSPTAKRIGAGALGAIGAGVGAAGFAGAVGATEKLYLAATKAHDFRQMMEANPDLHAHQQADPAGFNRMFTSLRTFAPDFTREPMVAGAYMRNAMEAPEDQRGMLGVRAMSELKQPRQGAASEAAMTAFQRGLGETTKPKSVGSVKHVYDPETEGWKRTEETENQYA
jgi:hypothetical protein